MKRIRVTNVLWGSERFLVHGRAELYRKGLLMLNGFFAWNKRLCGKIETFLPAQFKRHLFTSYKFQIAAHLDSAAQAMTVLDIGGGKECPYLPFMKTTDRHRIVAVDIDAGELRLNQGCRLKVAADAAAEALPFAPSSVDLVTSRSTIEHVHDNTKFLGNCACVLREGGLLVSAFPCRFAPFAIFNRLLPDKLARLLLFYFQPQWQDVCGFKVYYDHCTYREMSSLLDKSGFDLIQLEFRYYQAIYYDFFVPIYLAMLAYDLFLWSIGARNLCCQILFFARKRIA